MKSASYGWIEAAIRYTGRFGPREKKTYGDVFQLSAPSVSRHQDFVAVALEEACESVLFQRTSNGHLKGGKLLLLNDAELPSSNIFARVPSLENWLHDTFEGNYFHEASISRNQVESEIVRSIISALIDKKPLRMQYHSKTAITWRTISPHVIIKVAGRLHLRAFDHLRNEYRDFVLPRISQIGNLEGESRAYVGREHDHEWSTYVSVKIKEKAVFSETETQAVRMEFGLNEYGMKTIQVRKAVAPYLVDAKNDNFRSPVEKVLEDTQ